MPNLYGQEYIMTRVCLRVILCSLAIFFASLHYANRADAVAHCFDSPPEGQFDSTYALENQDGTFIVGLNGTARFQCTVNWRTTFQALYKASSDPSWHLGFDNAIYAPNAVGHYDGYTDVFFQPAVTPPAFTGYWTPGDGLNAARPVCQWQWRVRERFTNTSNGNLDNTLYSPTVNPTC
jgi:hypothetical protein